MRKSDCQPTRCERSFVCIPRPITRSEKPDGGPLRYRVLHTAALWKSGERPQLKTSILEGDAGLAIWLKQTRVMRSIAPSLLLAISFRNLQA